jgi:hypothetical protein
VKPSEQAGFGQPLRGQFLYTAYGLAIRADEPIPTLQPSGEQKEPDIVFHTRNEPVWLPSALSGAAEHWDPSQTARKTSVEAACTTWVVDGGRFIDVRYRDGTRFLIETSSWEIWSSWPKTSQITDTAAYFVGPILGFVLALRGLSVLHASVVCIDQNAIALLGPGRAGKSTTCAAFALQGFPVLTEDVAAIRPAHSGFEVLPGYPVVRLWPDSVDFLLGDRELLPELSPGWEKRRFDLGTGSSLFANRPYPLAAIYHLSGWSSHSAAPTVEPLHPSQGLITLIGNTYATQRPTKRMRAQEFRALSSIVASTPIRRVTLHTDPFLIGRMCDLIVTDFRSLGRSASDLHGAFRNDT